VNKQLFCFCAACSLFFTAASVLGQIDPEHRELIQFGYTQPLEGIGPLAGYGYYYLNDPGFLRTNITLRVAVAPVYLDAELGFSGVISPHTDLAVGFAGGGFADSYYEVRGGKLYQDQSFYGHGAEVSGSLYQLVNPGQLIPLNYVLRLAGHYSLFDRTSDTASGFVLPPDRSVLSLRTGFRLGGREPVLLPDLAMELSAWYEAQFRSGTGPYGYDGDREVEAATHQFWARALLIYTLPESKQNFSLDVTSGLTINADRFSAYRIGGSLPLTSEFPLILPGYYYQEISASRFVLFSGSYSLPLDKRHRWNLVALGSVAGIDYLPGFALPDHIVSGVGAGLQFKSSSGRYQVVLNYSYGIDAVRNGGLGANTIGLLCQVNLEAPPGRHGLFFDDGSPDKSRGLFHFFGQ
jgi:hypothetical protein